MTLPHKITADEFERGYAERSGLTVEGLRELGLQVRPCGCGEDGCEGWQMAHGDRLRDIDDPDQPWVR